MKCHRTALMPHVLHHHHLDQGEPVLPMAILRKKVCQNVTKHDLEMVASIKLVVRDGIRQYVSPVGWRLPTTVLPK